MRDLLPEAPKSRERGIVNLDNSRSSGTHWVALYIIHYFDSFGNLQPPREVVKYLGRRIHYNYDRVQDFDTYICGHLSLAFLLSFAEDVDSKPVYLNGSLTFGTDEY